MYNYNILLEVIKKKEKKDSYTTTAADGLGSLINKVAVIIRQVPADKCGKLVSHWRFIPYF